MIILTPTPAVPPPYKALESIAPFVSTMKTVERMRRHMLLHPRRTSLFPPKDETYQGMRAMEAPPHPLAAEATELSEPEVALLLECAVDVERFQNWLLWGYLVCPGELLLGKGIDALIAVLSESFVGALFRDIYVMIHEEYDRHALPKIKEVVKSAKVTRAKQQGWDTQYQAAKEAVTRIGEMAEVARVAVDAVHRLRRTLIKQELMQCLHCLRDDPSLTTTSIRPVLAVLSLSRFEVLWYFRHVNVPLFKTKSGILQAAGTPIPVPIDSLDPTIGFLLEGITSIRSIIRQQSADIALWAESEIRISLSQMLSILRSSAGVDVERDAVLRRHLAALLETGSHLSTPARTQDASPAVSAASFETGPSSRSLTGMRMAWSDVLVHVSSTRSGMNLRYLHKSTGAERPRSLVEEGNALHYCSRLVDELPQVLAESSTLKELCYFRPQLWQVFRHTMFGLEGRPHHCCAWLLIAPMFPENAHENVPSELAKLNELAVDYMESVIDSVMSGVDGLVSVIMGEHCLASLDEKVAPSQGARWLNKVERSTAKKSRAAKRVVQQEPLPGFESQNENRTMLRTMEAALQRLTILCSAIGLLKPIQVSNEVFDAKEFLHERLSNLFRARIFNILLKEGDLERPSAMESEIRRLVAIAWMTQQHAAGLPVTATLREIMLSEAFTGGLTATPAVSQKAEEESSRNKFKAVTIVRDWYMANLARDVKATGAFFSPLHCQLSSSTNRERRGVFERATCRAELEALVRVFGPHICDGLESALANHAKDLLQRLGLGLQRNREVLGQLQRSLHLPISRDEYMRTLLVEVEPLMAACTELGHCLSLRRLLHLAAARCLRSAAPMLLDVAEDIVAVIGGQVLNDSRAAKLLRAATVVGGGTGPEAAANGDVMFVFSAMQDMGALDPPWPLLPLLFAAFVGVGAQWAAASFNTVTGGFSNGAQGLARCINACVFAAALAEDEKAFKRLEILRMLPLEGPFSGMSHLAMNKNKKKARGTLDAVIAQEGLRMLRQFLQCAATVVLCNAFEEGRKGAGVAIKLRFLHHLAESCPFLPRGILEEFVPAAVLRGVLRRTGVPNTRGRQELSQTSSSSSAGDGAAAAATPLSRRHSSAGVGVHMTHLTGEAPDIHQPQSKRRSSSPFLSIFTPTLRRKSYDSHAYAEEIVGGKDDEQQQRPRRGSYSGVIGARLLRGPSAKVPSGKGSERAGGDHLHRPSSSLFYSGPLLERSTSVNTTLARSGSNVM